ncbi:DUF3597 domain-containing protein [Erythrobacter sp. GH1-10]|uniref:DUF3597 domain-containing protein n=1 Tax=Erythrobacter sp. GH1-10 TaxID=3349334 RepID=UPI003877D40C
MGIFSSIKNAIFGDDKDEAKAETKGAPTATTGPRTPAPISMEEVERRISNIPGAEKLNWQTSIVDLLKLVKIDPSYANRKELAQEMGNTDYSGTAEDNIALHKAVMEKIAEAGGVVPGDLKD